MHSKGVHAEVGLVMLDHIRAIPVSTTQLRTCEVTIDIRIQWWEVQNSKVVDDNFFLTRCHE